MSPIKSRRSRYKRYFRHFPKAFQESFFKPPHALQLSQGGKASGQWLLSPLYPLRQEHIVSPLTLKESVRLLVMERIFPLPKQVMKSRPQQKHGFQKLDRTYSRQASLILSDSLVKNLTGSSSERYILTASSQASPTPASL